jgi:hypothetical protein
MHFGHLCFHCMLLEEACTLRRDALGVLAARKDR